MKKTLIALTLILVLVLSASCAPKQKANTEKIYLLKGMEDATANSILENIPDEFYYKSERADYQDTAAAGDKSITIDTFTLNGTYKTSQSNLYTSVILDYYNDAANNAEFAVSRTTGALGYYKHDITIGNTATITISLQEGEQIAREFARQFVDIENYTMTSADFLGYDGSYAYSYAFKRYIQNIETSDWVFIHVDNRNGDVYKYKNYAAGDFNSVSVPNQFELQATLDEISSGSLGIWSEAQVASASVNATRQPSFQAQSDNCMFVKTPDGHLALSTTVEVSGIGDDGRTEAIGAVIIID